MYNCKTRQNEEFSLSGPRNHKKESVDFSSEILPVTCGEKRGLLIKRKLKRGKFQGLL